MKSKAIKTHRRSTAQRRRVCYHEAGHAIIAELVGSDVKSVDTLINRAEKIWGTCRRAPLKDRRNEFLILMAGYAGEVVESLNRGKGTPKANLCGRDIKAVESRAADWMGPRNTQWRRQRIYAGATVRAAKMLQKHYPVFDALAKHLSQRRKLDGRTVRAMFATFRMIPSERGVR